MRKFNLFKRSINIEGLLSKVHLSRGTFFCFPKCMSAVWNIHFLEVNRQKRIGVGTWIKNCPLNRRFCCMEDLLEWIYYILCWTEIGTWYFSVNTPQMEILRTLMRISKKFKHNLSPNNFSEIFCSTSDLIILQPSQNFLC